MDCGSVYIKMCEKAEEIQSHHFIEGDYIGWYDRQDGRSGVGFYNIDEPELGGIFRYTWLPRQDQLQGMVYTGSLLNLLFGFYNFVELEKAPSYSANFTSMEQLWLAFVMSDLYQKVWSGTDWVRS